MGGGNYIFPGRLNIIVVFAAALFLAAAVFVTYSEQNESDAAVGTWNCGPNGNGDVTATLTDDGVLTISGTGNMNNYSSYSSTPWYSVRTNITSIIIKSGVTSIGNSAFQNCTSLKTVTIEGDVGTIGTYAFYGCTSLKTVTIEGDVGTIGNWAFQNCTSLTSINIPKSVTSIGNVTFYNCTSLTSIVIPDKVTTIDNYTFANCTSLKTVTVEGNVETIDTYAFQNCTSLGGTMVQDILHSVTSIGTYAFSGCTGLTSLVIPDSVETIGTYAFSGCNKLTSVIISDKVTIISERTFQKCTSLTSVIIPDKVTVIGTSAFIECASLKIVTMNDDLKTIGSGAFYNCTGLTSVIIPDKVTEIGSTAFYSCTSLTSINIPKSVTSIGVSAFAGSGLTSVTIPDTVTIINNATFQRCTSLTSVVIPDSVTSIIGGVFLGCTSLTSVVIPDKATINNAAFQNCTGLTSVTVTGGLVGEEKTLLMNGIIDKYFKDGTDWKLPGMSDDTIVSLTLRDISSSDYDPNSKDGKGGIAGDGERELYYSNTKFTWNTEDSKWDVNTYTVTIAKETGVSGFGYTVTRDGSVICTEQYTEPFAVNHGDTFTVTALMYGEYAFDKWQVYPESSVHNSKNNPLTVQYVSGDISLTAYGELIQYYVTFDSGSDYTVYVNGSPASQPICVTGKGSLVFSVQTPEGYSAVPVIEGIANLTAQSDGSYRISEIYSNVRVTATVTADGGNGSGEDSGNGNDSGNGSGNGNTGDGTDGGNSVSYWMPIVIIAVFFACVAIAWMSLFFFKRGKEQ
ncbi:MAG: leucine-rich repeat domain-containing protein [Candidatus Methanoplasma sp.]|jgi:hypothetical protein|nr:leucine-rich repeat domain-containing protein [Candidatus Methanoplasma sp.]